MSAASDQAQREQIKKLIVHQVDMLDRYESVDGGWGYYDFNVGARVPTSSSTSFVNAAVLVALYEAKEIGIALPEKMVNKALAATERSASPIAVTITANTSSTRRWPASIGRAEASGVRRRAIWRCIYGNKNQSTKR